MRLTSLAVILIAVVPLRAETTTFAVFGDFGRVSQTQTDVADLVKSWNPDFIATTGDNSYTGNYKDTVGSPYGDFVDSGRFFPVIGNNDWSYLEAYVDYFDLPGNEIYYDVVIGDIHLFMYDNNYRRGGTVLTEQDQWLREATSNSTANWKFLFAHQPRAVDSSRGNHVPDDIIMSEGIDAFFSGHSHYYQRSQLTETIPSYIVGNGGSSLYPPYPGTNDAEVFYNDDHGALKVVVDGSNATFEFWSIANGGTLIDSYSIPEPSSFAILVTGLCLIVIRRRIFS